MKIQDHVKFWLENAEKDLESSENMYNAGIFDWSLFVGHLALEKILKSLLIKNIEVTTPPKLHNLVRIAELAKIDLSVEQREFLYLVNQFHLEARYQEYKENFKLIATKEFTQIKLKQIKELLLWLKSQII